MSDFYMLSHLALMYSLYDTLLSNVRDVDDEINIAASGFLTGVTYTAPHGLKRMAKGGVAGLLLALGSLVYLRRDLIKEKGYLKFT